MLSIGPYELSAPVLLAPMAGVTDVPFRDMVCRFGAGLVVSEMVASHEMLTNRPGVRERAALGFDNGRTSVQIAGHEAHLMAEAARRIEANGAKLIDINMGCPAKKVTTSYAGSTLMRNPDHALSLIDAVAQATNLPVTLKMRLGWDDTQMNAALIAKRAENAGVQMITVHGRTRCQFYKGQADWAAVGAVVNICTIPVVVNGDIICLKTAQKARALSGAKGVMIGRGAQGSPWLLAQVAKGDGQPALINLYDVVAQHYQDMLSFYGVKLGLKMARKHLNSYLFHSKINPIERKKILMQTNPNLVLKQLKDALNPDTVYEIAA